MAVTIRDVARHADVSIATVSRALSAPDLVAERTRARVVAVARELGYEPNRAARSLITGRTGFIGAVVPDVANPFFLGALRGIQGAAREHGHHVLLADTAEDPVAEAELITSISRQVDGLVLLSSRLSVARLQGFPGAGRTVLFNRVLPGFPAVLLDSADGARQLVSHLAALGHRRLAYAGGPRESFADAERRRGLVKVCQDTDIRVIDLGSFPPVFASGARIADLALEAGVTAVIAFNDLVALGVIARLRDRRVDVPVEMSVTGFDDIPMASMSAPRLTTVSVPLEQAGRSAVELLLRQPFDAGASGIGSGGGPNASANPGADAPQQPRGRLLPVRLVVRSSTAAVRHPGGLSGRRDSRRS